MLSSSSKSQSKCNASASPIRGKLASSPLRTRKRPVPTSNDRNTADILSLDQNGALLNVPAATSSSTSDIPPIAHTSSRRLETVMDNDKDEHLLLRVLNEEEEEEEQQQQQQQYELNANANANATTAPLTISNIPSLVVAFSSSATTGGTSYAFGLYAAALKRQLQLSQGELDSISTAFFVAGLFSWLPGLCSDKFGTRLALMLGGITGATTLMLYWVVARQFIELPHASLVYVLSIIGIGTFLSCAMVTGAVFKIIVATAGPGLKGAAVGAAKGYVGLGAGLYACIFQAIRGPHTSDLDFLPLAATLFVTCATLPGWLLLPSQATLERCTVQKEATSQHVRVLYVSLVVLAILIVVNSMLRLYESSETSQPTNLHDNYYDMEQSASVGGNSTTPSNVGRSNFWLGGLLLSIWLGPIAILLVLPRDQQQSPQQDGIMLLPDHDSDDESEIVNNNNSSSSINRRHRDDKNTSAELDLDLEGSNSSRGVVRRRIAGVGSAVRASSSMDNEDDPLALSGGLHRADSGLRDPTGDEERAGLLAGGGGGSSSISAVKKEEDTNSSSHGPRLALAKRKSASTITASSSRSSGSNHQYTSSSERLDIERISSGDILSTGQGISDSSNSGEINMNMYEMLQTPSAMLLLWTTTMLVGAGTVMTNSAGQMVESLGFPAAVTPATLALFSVAQAAGRVLTGSLSEAALEWSTRGHCCCTDRGVPRPFFLVVASVLGFVGHGILALAHRQVVFVVGATLTGLAFGCVWPLMVLITGEIFGTANVGANYMFFDGFTSAAGTLLITKVVAQDVYERNMANQHHYHEHNNNSSSTATQASSGADANTCLGTGCFQDTHWAVAALSLTCVATSVGLMYTSRHIYNKGRL